MRFQYRHPRLYHILISLIYRPGLMAEVRREVGEWQTVFEVAAGYGRLAAAIHPTNRYHGIDLSTLFRNRFGATAGHAFDLHHHTTYLHHVVTFTRAANP